MLGGSSAVNYNMFSMASRQDLNNWKELGNEGWGFDDLAPYYRKSETYNPPSKILSAKINDKYVDPLLRGTSGPIQVSFCEADFAWNQETWPETCIAAGCTYPGGTSSWTRRSSASVYAVVCTVYYIVAYPHTFEHLLILYPRFQIQCPRIPGLGPLLVASTN